MPKLGLNNLEAQWARSAQATAQEEQTTEKVDVTATKVEIPPFTDIIDQALTELAAKRIIESDDFFGIPTSDEKQFPSRDAHDWLDLI